MSGNPAVAILGGAPTATGGSPSYTYCWSTNPISIYPGSNLVFTASDVLNDTTAANPTITDIITGAPITFYLKVKDALGCVSYDTCNVSFTRFVYNSGIANLYLDQNSISNGDSLTMSFGTGIGGSLYTPYTYSWQPAYGLSTTSRETGFHALPGVSTVYSVTIKDSKGCQSLKQPVYNVQVCPAGATANQFGAFGCVYVGINENVANKINLSVYPNPASTTITVKLPQGNAYNLKLTNVLVATCREISLAEEKTEIGLYHLNAGIYFLQVFEKGHLVAAKKIIKE